MKKILTSLVILLFFTCVYAQSSEVITEMLNSERVTFGQVCYFAAVHQYLIQEDAEYSEAIEILYKNGQIPSIVYPDAPMPLVDIAYLYAQMWNVKGGLMYKLFRGAPRYALKQLKADGVISKNKDPYSLISGAEALNIYTESSIKYGGMTLYIE